MLAEHSGPGSVPRARARKEGKVAGKAAAEQKATTGVAGPPKVPNLTVPGSITAGPTTPPTTPAKEHARVEAPTKTMSQLWTGRMADWGRKAYAAQVKRLTAPYLDVAGENAKATSKAEARVKGSKMGGAAKVGTGLGLATLAFTALGATEAGAKEHDPKKRLGAAGKQFKADLPGTAGDILKFTAADIGVTKVLPAVAKKAATVLGANATRAAFTAGLTRAVGRGALGAYVGYHALPFTGKKLAQLAHVAVEAKKAGSAATTERKGSEAKYGTVEQATKTRHAKEALKRAKAKKGNK